MSGPGVPKAEADEWLQPTCHHVLTQSIAGTPQRVDSEPAGNRCPIAELQTQAIEQCYTRWKQISDYVIIDWQQGQLDEALVLAAPSVSAHSQRKRD
jgi:hypothetical protein